jgi:hypothetical protein
MLKMRNRTTVTGAKNAHNQFIPASRYHGDRYPRTMEQAFGPGAQLSAPRRANPDLPVWIAAGAIAVILLCWALAQQ